MLLKICALLLLMIPVLSYSQSVGDWKLYINQKQIAYAKDDSVQTVQVHKDDDAALKFVFDAEDTAFVRRLIVMNEQRNDIDSKQLTANAMDVEFKVQELYRLSNGKNLTFYIVKTPANPSKAALVRVTPQPFCNLQWID